ncbi:MAG: S10 family peptidase [Candidatus Kariarchaeaceae archaeon]|jgi:carboxypeptidase C (cathepsin A)
MTDNGNEKNGKDNEDLSEVPEERVSETRHSVTIRGNPIDYIARAGTMIIHYEEDEKKPKAKAEVFYISYTKVGDEPNRPLTFSFNGGPGSSSVWLHLGLLGPKRVISEKDEQPVPPPYKLVENDYSILDLTDLVFIDPVSTGWSRPVPGEKAEQFHSYEKDLESVGEFIRLYTSRAKRWTSPKFLIGESYGTTRAAGLSGLLQQKHGMYLNGIMLVSSILNFQTARFFVGNDFPYMLFLPTYTATAWYHNKLNPELQSDLEGTLNKARDFASHEYNLALMKGDKLSEEEKDNIASKLSDLTGLSKEYVLSTNLRINIHRFTKELRRDERLTVGRLDSRFTGRDRDSAGAQYEYDPSYAVIQGPYTATMYDYVTRELEFENDLPYNILSSLYETWKYDKQQNQYLNVGETLRKAMSMNPFLKVFVANGYYDLATPFFATEYTMDHLQLEPELQGNLSMSYYEAGHMMYLKEEALAKLQQDLSEFFTSALHD